MIWNLMRGGMEEVRGWVLVVMDGVEGKYLRARVVVMVLHCVAQDSDLPEGWEMRKLEDGRTYYVDHNTRATSWVR